MKIIENILKGVEGYLISMERDTEHGWYVLNIGLPKNWVFDGNSEIDCEVVNETKVGKLIKVSPINETVVIDDLFDFVNVIIETNNRIVEKEKEFSVKMDEMKLVLENEAKKFYTELEELKENSFKKINNNFEETLKDKDENKPSEDVDKPSSSTKESTSEPTKKTTPKTKKDTIVEKVENDEKN